MYNDLLSTHKIEACKQSQINANMTTRLRENGILRYSRQSDPPGKIKIANALLSLIDKKEFNAITTAEIARVSGVNEALIYKYFKDKRGLLHDVLADFIEDFMSHIETELLDVKGAMDKLKKLLWNSIDFYNRNHVCAKILLLEVRNFPRYFESPTYHLARSYAHLLLKIIEEGIEAGEFRDDIPPRDIMQIILGGMEHLLLPGIIFGKKVNTDSRTESLYDIILNGIAKPKG